MVTKNGLLLCLLLPTLCQQDAADACLDSQSGVCLECNTAQFYYLQYGACQKYQGLHCLQIDQSGNCIDCDSGFLLSTAGVCIYVEDRVQNCAEYTDASGYIQCAQCKPGFILARLQCLQETPNCATYYPGRNRCQICKEGYETSWNRFSCEPVAGKAASN